MLVLINRIGFESGFAKAYATWTERTDNILELIAKVVDFEPNLIDEDQPLSVDQCPEFSKDDNGNCCWGFIENGLMYTFNPIDFVVESVLVTNMTHQEACNMNIDSINADVCTLSTVDMSLWIKIKEAIDNDPMLDVITTMDDIDDWVCNVLDIPSGELIDLLPLIKEEQQEGMYHLINGWIAQIKERLEEEIDDIDQ